MSGSVSLIDGHIDEVLKPCPFCGCKGIAILRDENENPCYPYYSQCPVCGAGARRGRTEAEAIGAWNRRVNT